MQQSSVIFANLLIAYLIFISLRGELPTYLTLLRGGGQQPSTGAGGGGNAITAGANALLNNNPLSSSSDSGADNSFYGSADDVESLAEPDYLTQLTGG